MANRDIDHPWLRPLWRRVLIVAFCALWAAYEFAAGSPTWGALFGAMAAYGAWLYLISYEANPPDGEKGKE